MESNAELMSALLAAQQEFPAIKKDTDAGGGQRKYKYATLDQIIHACRPALAKHKLVLSDKIRPGILTVELEHAPTGQKKVSILRLPEPNEVGWQAYGSALTYARRYAYSPMLGIASEDDDDGEAAEKERHARQQAQQVSQAVQAQQKPAQQAQPNPLAVELNKALSRLAPWSQLIDPKLSDQAQNALKLRAKLEWINGMLPSGKHVNALGELSDAELKRLTEAALAGEMPDDMAEPSWMSGEPAK